MKYIFKLSIIILASLNVSCNTNPKKDSNSKKQIDDYSLKIDSLIQTTTPRIFNGVILIKKNGETKYSKALGYSDFERKIPISLKDNFRIQSNSKQITAVLILKEVEKGKIDLQSPISNYLPNLKQPWSNKVTIHHLLNMTSGIATIEKPLIFEPGMEYKYSNPNYFLLGNIFKNVTGINISEAANDLFEELNMKNSFSYSLIESKDKVVRGYINRNNEMDFYDFYSDEVGFTEETWNNFIPTGGYISNVTDLSIWDSKLHQGKIIKPETYNLMTSYKIDNQHDTFQKMGYGYGIMISDHNSIKHIGHAGSGLGSVSIKFYIPKYDVNVVVLENQYIRNDRSKLYYFEKQIKEIILNSSLVR